MTFTDQNFTSLPFLNIRQSVLSLGAICHLSWAPELGKNHADGNGVQKQLYFVPALLIYRKEWLW